MQLMRSLLFVPGHKADWITKALNSEADAIIIDLEDAVPADAKEKARNNVQTALADHEGSTKILVRVNSLDSEHVGADVLAATRTGLTGLLLPKLYDRDCVIRYDALITAAEINNGVEVASTEVMASFETARSLSNAKEILSAPRVGGLMAAAARDSDISRELGYTWSPEGPETLYLRSRLIIEGRAAGLRTLVLGLWQDVRDLEGLADFARTNSALGYTGQVLIHPTHAPAANEAYGLDDARLDYYRRLVTAFEQAESQGHAATTFEGDHIDIAHARNAREILSLYA